MVVASPWAGEGADRFRADWSSRHAPGLGSAAACIDQAATSLLGNAAEQVDASNATGGTAAVGALAAVSVATASAGPWSRQPVGKPYRLPGSPVPHFPGWLVPAVTSWWGGLRGFDERGGRRYDDDQDRDRPPGGTSGRGSPFDYDWAGGAILERYMRGGGDWTISDDEHWTTYMTANQKLSTFLQPKLDELAVQAATGGGGAFDQRFYAEMENGEGVTGYQFLHGTDQDHLFGLKGDTTVTVLPDGNKEVVVHGRYTWSDVIDPNPQYGTDRVKNALTELITLGRAEPYDINITWGKDTVYRVAPDGTILERSGYPY
jgi:hypothetical protein